MRNQWRLLLNARSHFQVRHSFRSFSSSSTSLLQHPPSRAPHVPPLPTLFTLRRFYSSELAVDQNAPTDQTITFTDIFTKPNTTNDDIKENLESNNVVITHDLIINALKSLNSSPETARRLFDWVFLNESRKLSSKSYNLMVGVLGVNGFVKEFWDMVGDMKKRGYGVRKGIFDKVFEKFEQEGLSDDLEKLKGLYASGSIDNSVENLCSRVCRVIRRDVWGDKVEKWLRELNVEFSSDLVTMVVETIGTEQNKGLIFFRWVEESGLFKHDERTFNAMARVLGKEGPSDKFWRVVDEMKNAGFELDEETYVNVLEWFVKKKMMKDAVDLYEFAMGGKNKPSVQDCTFLLKKLVIGKELDMDLFSRVVRVFTESGNVLTNATLDAVLKSLTSVGRVGECSKILKAMQKGGFQPSAALRSKIAYQLGSGSKAEEACEFMDNIEGYGESSNQGAWASLVEGYCEAGDLTKASESLRRMVEKEEASSAGYALDLVVSAYCHKNRGRDAYKLVSEMINEGQLHAQHSTYKTLIRKLLAQGGFEEALDILGLMKTQGYPPFLDPFIKYLSKKGSADDAITFMKAMTEKRYPSNSVFLCLFEAYFKAGRQSEAQDFLSKCPRYIKNHADVLNLFCSMKSGGRDTAPSVAV